MPDRFGNPEKTPFKEMGMVNREYTEIIDEPKNSKNNKKSSKKNKTK